MTVLHLGAELWLRFDLAGKSRFAIAEFRYASTESKSLLRKLRCASENAKFKECFLFCPFNALNQWFSTEVLRHPRVSFAIRWGAASYCTLLN